MKEIIRKKLDNMNDLQQRRVLKNMMWDIFREVVDYQDNFNKQLEERLFEEIKDKEENYIIYNTIVRRDRLELVSDFLFPMMEEDREEKVYDKKEILESIRNNEPVSIARVFLKKTYSELHFPGVDKRSYDGVITTDDREVNITVLLKKCDDYIKVEEELYNIFMENGVKWTSINNPYIRKFYDVVIVDFEGDISDLKSFNEIVFDLDEIEEDKIIDYVPVWNIMKSTVKGDGFPLPAIDRVNYEHIIPYETMGVDNGYLLVPDQNIVSMRKTEDALIITSKESNSVEWELLTVLQENKFMLEEQYDFDLLSNKRKEQFVNIFLNKGNKVIRSFSELSRLANSFEIASGLQIEGIELIDYLPDEILTYDFNSYIEDEIRNDKFRKILLIVFKSIDMDYLLYDILSFIVSEIQLYFPEYICKGVIK